MYFYCYKLYYGCIFVFVWTLAIFKRKSKRESEIEKEKAFYMALIVPGGTQQFVS